MGLRLLMPLVMAALVLGGQPVFADESWLAEAEKEMAEIAARSGTMVVENLDLTDERDGLWRGEGGLRREAGPGELAAAPGDRHTLAFGKVDGLVLRNCRLSASVVAEALKLSACRNVVVENCLILGGKEDALDVVRGENLYFRRVTFVARGEYAVTMKASVRHVRFIDCGFRGNPSSGVFVDLGNWSDYDVLDRRPSGDVAFSSSCVFDVPPGRNVAPIRTLFADRPRYAGKVKMTAGWLVGAFFQIRRWQEGRAVLDKYSREELQWAPPPASP